MDLDSWLVGDKRSNDESEPLGVLSGWLTGVAWGVAESESPFPVVSGEDGVSLVDLDIDAPLSLLLLARGDRCKDSTCVSSDR